MKRAVAALAAAVGIVAGIGSCTPEAKNGIVSLYVQATPDHVPADAVTVVTVMPAVTAVPPLTFMTSFGLLGGPDGSSGQEIVLPQTGSVTLVSPCDAASAPAGVFCAGWARVSVVDAQMAVGSAIVVFDCPDGMTCARNPADQGPIGGGIGGGSGGGGSSITACTATLSSECTQAQSGYHFVGITGTAALNGQSIGSSSPAMSLSNDAAFTSVSVNADNYLVRFADSSTLGTGQFSTTATLPSLSFDDRLGDVCSADPGSFAIDRMTTSGANVTEFQATFTANCGQGKVCGCLHFVR